MNTAAEGNLSEAGNHHAKHSALGQRLRYNNTHRHPTEKYPHHPQSQQKSAWSTINNTR